MDKDNRNFDNRTLYHGDNLKFMRAMNSESVDLIATDPPFNKSKDFHATPDSLAAGAKFQDRWSWERDVQQAWVDQIESSHPELHRYINLIKDSDKGKGKKSMAAFLCFLAVRLIAMHRILKPTGSIYLHCDQTASAEIRHVMDFIFGKKNFRAGITWKRFSAKSKAKNWGNISDFVFYYTKSNKFTWNTVYMPYSDEYLKNAYQHKDEKGRFDTFPLICGAGYNDKKKPETWRGVTRSWLYSIEEMEKMDAAGMVYWPKNGRGIPRYKKYLNMDEGVAIQNIITDIKVLTGKDEEKTGYPTQKPIALYERFIKASSNEGDFVFDPFCGCATTLMAAESLKRQWVGIDLWPKAIDLVKTRLFNLSNKLIFENGGEKVPEVTATDEPPKRTDDGFTAAPFMMVQESDGTKKGVNKKEAKAALLEKFGSGCQGCGMVTRSGNNLAIDHHAPKSGGGVDSIDNFMLLCTICNSKKGNKLTGPGLRDILRKDHKKTGDFPHIPDGDGLVSFHGIAPRI